MSFALQRKAKNTWYWAKSDEPPYELSKAFITTSFVGPVALTK